MNTKQVEHLKPCTEDEWISVEERLPNDQETENNYKFLVCNKKDNWVDAAYFDNNLIIEYNNGESLMMPWHNGECVVIPTHWKLMPKIK